MNLAQEVVTFRDGTTLTVTEANWSITIKLQDIEEEQAKETPLEDKHQQEFRLYLYPKLIACSSGSVPTLEEAFAMPSVELDKWYAAVRRVNPSWFPSPTPPDEKPEETVEKKSKKQTGSMKD